MKDNRNILAYAGFILVGLFVFLIYHFLVFPLFLDYGIYGVITVISIMALLTWLLPKGERLYWFTLAIGFLLVVRGMYRVEYKPIFEQLIAFLLLSIVFLLASKLIASKKTIVGAITLSLLAGLLTFLWDQEDIFFAKKFQVLYKSPKLYVDTNVEYFPLHLVDLNQDGKQEIITQGFVDDEYVLLGRYPMDLEASRYMVFQYDDSAPTGKLAKNTRLVEVGGQADIEPHVWNYVSRDYVGFPYYTTEWSSGENFIHRYRDRQQDLLKQGMLQMDFFYRLEDELSGDIVDNLGITSSLFDLLNRDSHPVDQPMHNTVDNDLNSVDINVRNSGLIAAGAHDLMIPLVDRLHLIHRFLPFGSTPFEALSLSRENLAIQTASWNDTVIEEQRTINNTNTIHDEFILSLIEQGAVVVGTAYLTDESVQSGAPELIVYRGGLEVYQQSRDDTGAAVWSVIARLTPAMLRQVADGEFLIADITKDGKDEILLSGAPSQVLTLLPNPNFEKLVSAGLSLSSESSTQTANESYPYAWQQLWVANDDIFRFEAVNQNHEVIALSQSFKRNEGRRFLTSYAFVPVTKGGSLVYEMQPLWRVHQSVINVRAGDITGDGKEEIVASYFRDHRFVVLKEHSIPVNILIWILTLVVILGLGYQKLQSSGNMQKLLRNHRMLTILVLLSMFTLAGCVHPSAVGSPQTISTTVAADNIASANDPSGSVASGNDASEVSENNESGVLFSEEEWRKYWLDAINFTHEHGQRFWYSGWVATKVQKRRTTSMFDGIVIRDGGDDGTEQQIMVNARLLGKPFAYYEAGDHIYMNEDRQWKRLTHEGGYPVDWMERYTTGLLGDPLRLDAPFEAMKDLASYNNESYRFIQRPMIVGRERILGSWTNKIVFTVEPTFYGDEINYDVLNTTMEWTIWVGEEDPYLYQYEVETLMPVPGAGMMQQKTFYRFWHYNDPTIQLTDPLAIEKQIVQREMFQIENILHTLEKNDVREGLSEKEIRLLELRLAILQNNVERSLYTRSLDKNE